jgi:4-aminobutyrate aminotransferase-like enzyme/Ser/Thr protein kinase RdoA (MazF antagonist)
MYFTEKKIAEIAAENYNLKVSVEVLNGYDELNYLLCSDAGEKYICKVGTDTQGLFFLEAQVKILSHLEGTDIADGFQRFIKNNSGSEITLIVINCTRYYIRVLTWLEGTFWVNTHSHNDDLCLSLGSFVGKMDKALCNFSHPALHRHYEWDISNTQDAEINLPCISDHEKRRIASYFIMQFRMEVIPLLALLRKACIHNDVNDYNVITNGDHVTGLIDFGDMVYSQLINNLAIACTYAMFGQQDPLRAASLVVKGYHSQYNLTKIELSILYYLIAGRLCISVTSSARQALLNSDNKHHFITEKNAWEALFRLIEINPLKAHDSFLTICGYDSVIPVEESHALLEIKRKQYIGRNLSISYGRHLKIVRGALQYLYDERGNTYIDCVNNVSHVGHCHPDVVNAIQKQTAILNTNTRYLHDKLVDYAEQLTALLPSKLKICYFTNSGSEANDLAIRMSRHYTERNDIIVLDHAYHGTSTTAMELSPYKFDGKGGAGRKQYIHKAMNPDLFRGAYRYGDQAAGKKYAADVQRITDELKQEKKGIAAFISETLLGVGGQIPLPEGYLKEVYRIVRAAGGICIADEVQVGFGRVGRKFWGFELQEAVPDIVVLGKPMGNGHPLAGVIVTEEIADAFNNGMEYFNTFGGNPVSMAAGLAVLNVIHNEDLQKNASTVGNYMLGLLKSLKEKYQIIGDVRGEGLFIGVELVRDRISLEPAVPEIDQIVEEMKNRGFLISTDGPLHNVLKIKPPIIFSARNADAFVNNLEAVLKEYVYPCILS